MITRTAIPAGPLGGRVLNCIEAATLAPSVHNSQPWRFTVHGGDRIDVWVDCDGTPSVIDPDGREAYIGVGAAIFNLRVAILAAGRTPLTRLLPEPHEPRLAARITVGPPHTVDMTVRALASAIAKRRTNRRPFRNIEVREEVLEQLQIAARTEGARLAIADSTGRLALLGLIRTANEWQHGDPAYLAELAAWVGGSERNVGVPNNSIGPVDPHEAVPLRDFGAADPGMPRRTSQFEPAPTLAVLYTAGDTVSDWLHAGQALQRVLLTATVRGVANTPITAPTELPNLRELLGDPEIPRAAQVILRLGYGDPVPPTPRRPLAEVVSMTDE